MISDLLLYGIVTYKDIRVSVSKPDHADMEPLLTVSLCGHTIQYASARPVFHGDATPLLFRPGKA